MKKIFYPLLTLVSFIQFGFSQTPTVDFSLTPAQLVQDVLAGPGVQISNVKFNDNPSYTGNRIGKFNYTGSQIAFGEGIVIGTGGVAETPGGTSKGMIGPNNNTGYSFGGTGSTVSNDVQLKTLDVQNEGLHDIGRLEFDFVPQGNKVSFEFIFGSEEYNEWVCSKYYDVFGFFVSGPNPNGGNYTNQNMALVPGTTLPISINTINNGSAGANGGGGIFGGGGSCPSGGLNNAQYFAGAPGGDFQMDGATVSMTIEFDVTCGETYHFKFAIADVGDANLDSWVFLKAGSFQSEAVKVSVATVSGDDTVIEGCTKADIIFTRPKDQSDTAMVVHYEVSGSAISGVDYDPLPNPIQFNAGEDSLILTLNPIQDGIIEGVDSVVIKVFIVNICGDTVISEGTIYIIDSLEIFTDVQDALIYCATDSTSLSVNATGGVPPFTYAWSNGGVGSTIEVPTSINGPFEYTVTATDACGFKKVDTAYIDLEQALKIDSILSDPSLSCLNTGFASGFASGFSGTPSYSWYGPVGTPYADSTHSKTITNIGGGWYYFTVSDSECEITDSVFIETIDPPVAKITAEVTQGCSPTTFVLNNESENATNYKWNTGSGYYGVGTKASQTVELSTTSYVYLIATDDNCADTTKIQLTIFDCGCTDPTAINFDADAQVDDGSCIYHEPEIELPNIFTPNEDGNNDSYTFIKQDYLNGIEYWIFNRWGNVMFHTTQLNTYWDGKVNGNPVAEGVYFIKYEAEGQAGQKISGHTFFHLVR